MKIQSVSQLSALSIEDLLRNDDLSAVIEVSKMNVEHRYDSQQFDFKNFIMWIQAQIANVANVVNDWSITINNNYVHRTGDEDIYGVKTFKGTLKADKNTAELTAQHALWS